MPGYAIKSFSEIYKTREKQVSAFLWVQETFNMGAGKNGARGGDTRGKFVAAVSDHWQIRFKSEKVRGHGEKEIVRRQRFFKYRFSHLLI